MTNVNLIQFVMELWPSVWHVIVDDKLIFPDFFNMILD